MKMQDLRNATVFHVTPSDTLPTILRQGLKPSVGPRSARLNEKPAVFVFPSEEAADDALMNWLGDEFDEDTELSMLEVTVPRSWLQPGKAEYEMTIDQPIPPEQIRVHRHQT